MTGSVGGVAAAAAAAEAVMGDAALGHPEPQVGPVVEEERRALEAPQRLSSIQNHNPNQRKTKRQVTERRFHCFFFFLWGGGAVATLPMVLEGRVRGGVGW